MNPEEPKAEPCDYCGRTAPDAHDAECPTLTAGAAVANAAAQAEAEATNTANAEQQQAGASNVVSITDGAPPEEEATEYPAIDPNKPHVFMGEDQSGPCFLCEYGIGNEVHISQEAMDAMVGAGTLPPIEPEGVPATDKTDPQGANVAADADAEVAAQELVLNGKTGAPVESAETVNGEPAKIVHNPPKPAPIVKKLTLREAAKAVAEATDELAAREQDLDVAKSKVKLAEKSLDFARARQNDVYWARSSSQMTLGEDE